MDTPTETSSVSLPQWLAVLHLSDSALPIGSFAYSEGVEAAVQEGQLQSAEDLAEWWNLWRTQTFRYCEGPALCQLMQAFEHSDQTTITQLNRELTALKPAKTLREGSHILGRRLLSTCAPLYPSLPRSSLQALLPELNGLTVQAALYVTLGIPEELALASYAFGRLNQSLSAGLRLFALGQQAGQELLQQQLQQLPATIQEVRDGASQPLSNFTPHMDVLQMKHATLYTRLFRS